MNEWNIDRRRGVCAASGREFADGEPIYSVLVVEEGALSRVDVSRDAWKGEEVDEHAIWWRTRYREQARGQKLDLESIEGLFTALEAAGQQEGGEPLLELRFLLSLILMRKRRLKIIKTRRTAEGDVFVVRRPRRTEELSIRVFDLTPERTAVLREVLQSIFDGADLDEVTAALEGPLPRA